MRFGLHLSTRNGLEKTLEEARRLKCDTIQIFTRSPRMWRTREITREEAAAFCSALKKSHIHPLVVHTPYLPNLCTSDRTLYHRSLDAFKKDIERACNLCASYLVIHPGSYSPEKTEKEGFDNLLLSLDTALSSGICLTVLLENMAGGGRRLGYSFEHLARVIERSRFSEHLGICLDTCHAVGAGFDLSTEEGINTLIKTLSQTVTLEKVKLLHVNDSRSPVASHLDRHEHIGKGFIGTKGFRFLLTHPAFRNLPAILETPKDAPGADKKNLALVRKLSQ